MGIAKVTESMQLCAYYLTINYYMVKLTNYKKAIDRPLSCKRWGIIAIIILLQVAYLFYCTLTFRMMLIILSVTVCYACLIMFLKKENTFITAI